MNKPETQSGGSLKPVGSAFDRRRLTRLAVYNLVRNWMIDGCSMHGEIPADEGEVWRILGRIVKKKPNQK